MRNVTVTREIVAAAESEVLDRIYVMQDGRIVACGPPETVLTPELVAAVFSVRLRRGQDAGDGRLHLTFERLAPERSGI